MLPLLLYIISQIKGVSQVAKTKAEIQKEYLQRTGYQANNKFNKANTKQYAFRVMLKTEQDIIERMESVDNKAGYIKRLIREDIAREQQ